MNDFTRAPSENSNNNRRNLILLGGCLALFICLACVGVVGLAGGLLIWQEYGDEWLGVVTTSPAAIDVSSTPVSPVVSTVASLPEGTPAPDLSASATLIISPTAAVPTATGLFYQSTDEMDMPQGIKGEEISDQAKNDLLQLYLTDFPSHDYYEAAVRLNGYQGDRTVFSTPYQIGDRQTFYNNTEEVEATLIAITNRTYFWVEDGLDLDPTAVTEAANRFETTYYDQLTHLLGEIWSPGMDNDPHISVLHVSNGEGTELGYFEVKDEYPQAIFEKSNEREIIYLNMDLLEIGEDLYFATLVHEVQHLTQWYLDPSESTWLNEGMSQFAEFYLGFSDTVETIDYLDRPETRLNNWSYEEDEIYAHYGGVYLFVVYLWEQLGEMAVHDLARDPANGLASVQTILNGFAPGTSVEQFAANWAVANYLDYQRRENSDPRYYYKNLDIRRPAFQHKVQRETGLDVVETLDQFGAHYIDLTDLRGETIITFVGDTTTKLIDVVQQEDSVFWYVPPMNGINAHLTATFDLAAVSQANLTYSVWYDLEEDFDFAYVSISTDGGATWVKLPPEHISQADDRFAFNGRSSSKQGSQDGWLKETISLDEYVGQTIMLRFDVLTDSAITGRGFALDNIVITGSGGATTFENQIEGWESAGFVYTGQTLPQQWAVILITKDPESANHVVTPLGLNEANQGQWRINLGKDGAVLVIMPQTAFVKDPANYWLKITQ